MVSPPEFLRSGHLHFRAPHDLSLVAVPSLVSDLDAAVMWCPWIVVDLSEVEQLEACCVDVLAWGKSHARRHGGDLVIGCLASAIDDDLRGRLRRQFSVYDELAALPMVPLRTRPTVVIPAQLEHAVSRRQPTSR